MVIRGIIFGICAINIGNFFVIGAGFIIEKVVIVSLAEVLLSVGAAA